AKNGYQRTVISNQEEPDYGLCASWSFHYQVSGQSSDDCPLMDTEDERRSSSHERLVPVSSTRCRAYTPGLSTWWSTTALKGELVSRWVSRLDAFSDYPVRT